MSEHTHQALHPLALRGSCRQGGAEAPFVARNGALRLPTVCVLSTRKTPLELPPVLAPGPSSSTPQIDWDHREPNSQVLPAPPVVRLTVKRSIGQHAVNPQKIRRLTHDHRKLRRIIAGTLADGSSCDKVCSGMARQGQFRPKRTVKPPPDGATRQIMRTRMPVFQARRIDGNLGPFLDQAAVLGILENSSLQPLESPFFINRFSAFSRVVQ